ncbi:orotidine-5'-phosphate decarboxylase [Anaerotardibacter muris]|uniref:orotidine-5'-phosphate decarboxylase n=1 Tax=Anaerotardibacter muris TaxID=2941505 RepID=UPI0020418A87|nr:orotidine-5'-phosphate decarboxylase [Anaerotardibacter muris]
MLDFTAIPERERIIVALDCSGEEALAIARSLQGRAAWLKVGMTLYYQEGPQIIAKLKDMGFNVFVDLKFHDIPYQVYGAATSVARAGADMFTLHTIGGLEMMRSAVDGLIEAGRPDVITLGITVLTSMSEEDLELTGVTRSLPDQVRTLAQQAQTAGLTGVVASPQEAAMLRKELGREAYIVTPGVRPVGASLDDQSRVATPRQAFDNGASHLVIGRPITAAADPAEAFESIVKGL